MLIVFKKIDTFLKQSRILFSVLASIKEIYYAVFGDIISLEVEVKI